MTLRKKLLRALLVLGLLLISVIALFPILYVFLASFRTDEEIFKYADFVKRKNRAIGVISINYSDGDKRLEKIMELCNKYLDVSILTENETLDSGVMEILERCDRFENNGRILYMPMRSQAIENAIEIMNRNDTLIIIGKGNERFLSMALGKEFYYGDKHYAVKFIEKRRREENERLPAYRP